MNGDGKTDLIQQWNNNGIFWLLPYVSKGTRFVPTNWINTMQSFTSGPGQTPGIVAADLNGDGKTDLLQQFYSGGTLYLIPYTSTGSTYTEGSRVNTNNNANSTGFGDSGFTGGDYYNPITWNCSLFRQVLLDGSGVAGATIQLSGSSTSSLTTTAGGSYLFNVAAAGNYTLTPSLSGKTFSPSSKDFAGISSNQLTNFFATTPPPPPPPGGGSTPPANITPSLTSEYIYLSGKVIAIEH